MKLTPEQILSSKEWNKLVAAEVENALGAELDGKFTAANYTAGFNYQVKLKNYNADSIKALDTRIEVQDGIPCLKTGYASLYGQVIGKLCYDISKEDRDRINQEANAQSALIATIINSYKESDIDDEIMKDPTVPKIMKKVKDFTGTTFDKVNLREYPYLANLCNLLSEFTRKAVFTSKIQRASQNAEDRLEAIREHIKTPTEDNGGLKTDGGFVCGWENIKEPAQLLESLEGGNSISFTVKASDFHEDNSRLSFNNKVNVDVPVNWFLSVNAKHSDSFDLSKLTKNGSELSVTVTYNGITVVPANPSALSADNASGWYADDILKEAAAKSGKDVTGYKLIDGEFNPKTLFGEDGELRRMRTIIISQQPSVKLHFSKFNCSQLKKQFDEHTDVSFSILGGIVSGTHENGYSVSKCDMDENSQSLDVTLTPPKLGSSGSAGSQAAYILGGVADYFDNTVEVKKIRMLNGKKHGKAFTAISEELGNLSLAYRKGKDGRYEFAGLYDQNEDTEYMLGDTVAVPITSRYVDLVNLPAGTRVWNVQGSSGDSCSQWRNASWIEIWRHLVGGPDYSYVYCLPNLVCGVCPQRIVGAHLVTNENGVTPDINDYFYIVPICNRLNNRAVVQAMTIRQDVVALRLTRFMELDA